LARKAMILLHQGETRRTSEDLEGGKPPLAPDRGLAVKLIVLWLVIASHE